MIDWQMPLTLVIVAMAAAYLIRSNLLRSRSKSAECAGGCCDKGREEDSQNPASKLISPEELMVRLKRTP